MNKLIIYHSNCGDGFCSAWLCHLVWPDAEFVAANYGWEPPDVHGKDVLIVDFSYDRKVLEKMAKEAATIKVLDHHETARNNLEGLSFCVFDMSKSGAHLTWDYLIAEGLLRPHEHWPALGPNYFAPVKGEPKLHWLVAYVEDYDLQNEALPNYDEICTAIRNHDFTFEAYDALAKRSPESLVEEGRPVSRYQNWLIDHHVKYAVVVEINGVKGIGSQCSMNKLWTKVGRGLLNAYPEFPFAVIWQDTAEGLRLYSLRARKGGFNVRELAESMGGGGHTSSAGFKVNYQTSLSGPVSHLRRPRPKPDDPRSGKGSNGNQCEAH
jgi:hypothetical protein